MKKYEDRRGCYQVRLKAEVENILLDLHNSLYHTKAEFNGIIFLLFIQNISKFLRVDLSKDQRSGGQSSKFNFAYTLYIGFVGKEFITLTVNSIFCRNYLENCQLSQSY